jgi:hypothetical protein
MSDEETPIEQVVEGTKRVLGCGLQTVAVLIGVVLLFAVVFAAGLWLFGLLS